MQKEGCKFESHVWHMDKKFVSFNCVLYTVVTLFFSKGTHVLCYNRSGSNIFFDVKEHISCVTIYQIVTFFWM